MRFQRLEPLTGVDLPTSTPSLEERLDDHQPTRAWENG